MPKITVPFHVCKVENKKPVKGIGSEQVFAKAGQRSDSYQAPQPEDFHKYLFRLLSADIIVGLGGYNCSFFPNQVLRQAMPLFEGVPAVYNHSRDVQDTVGNVVDTYYENAYINAAGKAIPAGINGYFKISDKLYPDLCYKLDSDPSPIQSTSCMIEFEWEPSHVMENDPYFFWRYIGEEIVNANGEKEVVHMRATQILNVTHQGLVYDSADPYAKKQKSENRGAEFMAFAKATGVVEEYEAKKIAQALNEGYRQEIAFQKAQAFNKMGKNNTTTSFSQQTAEEGTEGAAQVATAEPIKDTTIELSAEDKAKIENYNALLSERDLAKKELKELKTSHEALTQSLKDQKAELTKAQGQIAVLQKENLELASTLKEQKPMVDLAKELYEKKIAHVQELYAKSVQGKTNQAMLELIEKTPFEALDELIVSFGGKAMSLFGEPTCDKCGNKGFVFRSSKYDGDNGERDSQENESIDMDSKMRKLATKII